MTLGFRPAIRTFVVASLLVVSAASSAAFYSSTASAASPTVPTAPTLLGAQSADGALSVSWSANGDGGSPVTSFKASANDGTNTFSCTSSTNSCNISGLTNGVSYVIAVIATNAVGDSAPSSTLSATPFTTPTAPTLVSAQGANGTIAVNWSANSNGGSAVTLFTASANDGTNTFTCTSSASSCVISGLTNGVSYSVTVVATNRAGDSVASNALSGTPFTTPTAPTLISAKGANGTISVNWSANNNGGSSVTSFTARAFDGTKTTTCQSIASSCVITGVTNGVSYSVTVVATNGAGDSSPSFAMTAVPFTTPTAPTLLSALGASQTIIVSWAAHNDGGSPVTSFTAIAFDGTNTFTCTSITSACTISGLTFGVNYFVTVFATNNAGDSAQSNALTASPITTPNAPSSFMAQGGNKSVVLSWTPPLFTGGSTILRYVAILTTGTHLTVCTTTATRCTFGGLTNGVHYSAFVYAINKAGRSIDSKIRGATPRAVPNAPIIVKVQTSLTSITVTWLKPVSNGGSPIEIYSVTASGAGKSFGCTTIKLHCKISGLNSTIRYTVLVRATNAVGVSLASKPFFTSPITKPSAPLLKSVRTQSSALVVVWRAPLSNGNSRITVYTATARRDGGSSSCSTNLLTCVIPGLINGYHYVVTVTATNVAGTSVPSHAATGLACAVPSAPSITQVAVFNQSIFVKWSPSKYSGGSPVTKYTAYATSGVHHFACATTMTSCSFGGLTNVVAYIVSVTATNVAGNSLAATLPAAVYPMPSAQFAALALAQIVPVNAAFGILVSGAHPGKVVLIHVGDDTENCVANSLGQCVTFGAVTKIGIFKITAIFLSNGTHTTSTYSINIAAASLSSTTVRVHHPLTLTVRAGLANSTLSITVGTRHISSAALSSTGLSVVTFTPTATGQQRVIVSDAGVVLLNEIIKVTT